MQTTHATATESAIWGRLLLPGTTRLTPEAARSILAIDFPQSDKDRMHELVAKARRGTLSRRKRRKSTPMGGSEALWPSRSPGPGLLCGTPGETAPAPERMKRSLEREVWT